MKKLTVVKRTAAIVLFVTFFLPLSQCQKKQYRIVTKPAPIEGETSESTVETVPGPVGAKPLYTYHIPATMSGPTDPFYWLIVLAFSWPLLVWAWLSRDKRPRLALLINVLELPACLGSGFVSWSIAFLGDILFWGYLSLASIVTYFLISSYELLSVIKQHVGKDSGPVAGSRNPGDDHG